MVEIEEDVIGLDQDVNFLFVNKSSRTKGSSVLSKLRSLFFLGELDSIEDELESESV